MVEITNDEFCKISRLVKQNIGVHLKDEKKTLVRGRLQSTLVKLNLKNFTEYYDYLVKDNTGVAINNLVERITTNHTYFMREKDHFDYLQSDILPYIENIEKGKNKDVCIWSAGCSSGEEPYTIQMILNQYFGIDYPNWNTEILATDISPRVLRKAKSAIYDKDEVEGLDPKLVKSYFKPISNDQYIIKEHIKDNVTFRSFNLMKPSFSFKRKFHVIFCRNVMIYFDIETKKQLVEKFYDCLHPGGYLLIGHSESLLGAKSSFKYIKSSVYRKA